MDRLTLFEEYRLIERNDSDISGAWKGMHLLLFFLAFVFGSFCTFCFHMLMYLFDEKCVLFPKLLSLTSLRHNVIYEFIPEDKAKFDMLPVDFLSTQWMEKSACYLPTYVPLVSGIFGLVWTTMFLMCSTGGRTLTGLQRSWRVLPPVFVFSLAMGSLCIYSSVMTHYGLEELCVKLGEITGSSTCSYTVNVATLAYERQIRGVYQATRLTIFSAWLHTSCWVLSAILALVRVLLAVDFQLVRVSVDLVGNIDTMLERHEQHIRTVSANMWQNNETTLGHTPSYNDTKKVDYEKEHAEDIASLHTNESDLIFFADPPVGTSELSLVPEELQKLSRLKAYLAVPKEHQFIVKLVYDLMENLELSNTSVLSRSNSSSSLDLDSDTKVVARQFGREDIATNITKHRDSIDVMEAKDVAKEIKRLLNERLNHRMIELKPLKPPGISRGVSTPGTSKQSGYMAFEESTLNLTEELKKTLQEALHRSLNDLEQQHKKSNLKHKSSQTDREKKKSKPRKVKISESIGSFYNSDESGSDSPKNKETQTKPKEKQD